MHTDGDQQLSDDVVRMKNDSGLQSLPYVPTNRAAALADLYARWPLISETTELLRATAAPLRFGSRKRQERRDA